MSSTMNTATDTGNASECSTDWKKIMKNSCLQTNGNGLQMALKTEH